MFSYMLPSRMTTRRVQIFALSPIGFKFQIMPPLEFSMPGLLLVWSKYANTSSLNTFVVTHAFLSTNSGHFTSDWRVRTSDYPRSWLIPYPIQKLLALPESINTWPLLCHMQKKSRSYLGSVQHEVFPRCSECLLLEHHRRLRDPQNDRFSTTSARVF